MKGIKKVLFAVSMLCCLAAAVLCFAACGSGADKGPGVDTPGTDTPGAHTHMFLPQWSHDDKYHWHECICGEKNDKSAHVFNKYVCNICGYEAQPVIKVASIILSKSEITIFKGSSQTILATILPVNATESIDWLSTAPNIATVKNGVVTAKNEGTVQIVVSSPSGAYATCNVTVTEDPKGLVFKEFKTGYAVVGYDERSEYITIPSTYNGKNVLAIGTGQFDALSPIADGFAQCAKLKEVILPDTIQSINHFAFAQCSNLEKVIMREGLLQIGNYAFSKCSSLRQLNIPDSVTVVGSSILYGCSEISELKVSSLLQYTKGVYSPLGLFFGTEYYEGAIATEQKVEESNLTRTYYIPQTLKKVEVTHGKIGPYAFCGCKNIQEVVLGNFVTDIGKYAFYDDQIKKVTIGSSVTSIGNYAFGSCSNLSEVEMLTENLESIGKSAFFGCGALQTIEIPKGVKRIEREAFSQCGLKGYIKIPASVTFVGQLAFEHIYLQNFVIYCESENSAGWEKYWDLVLWSNTSRNPSSGTIISVDGGVYCSKIWDCNNNTKAGDGYEYIVKENIVYKLKGDTATINSVGSCNGNINIPENITYHNKIYVVIGIEKFAFFNLRITSVTIPDSMLNIGEYAFDGCRSLTSITIPNSVTSIGEDAFNGCSSLTSITIPDSVKSIGIGAFGGCSNLTIYCEAESKPSGWNSNWNRREVYPSVLYCPVVWGYKG